MTAKEKANELALKYTTKGLKSKLIELGFTDKQIAHGLAQSLAQTKEYALIAVNEVIMSAPLGPSERSGDCRENESVAFNYWQEVKKEIKSL